MSESQTNTTAALIAQFKVLGYSRFTADGDTDLLSMTFYSLYGAFTYVIAEDGSINSFDHQPNK